MPDRQAVVTLHPLFLPDALPFRSLTFNSDSDYFNIGRASKRESKNLAPAHHNAYFESRVMSRNHARLGVSSQYKNVYIRDGGSMHGTFVNDKIIPRDQDVNIKDGDVLTFGTEVSRGTETYAPLRVRCECQWFDTHNEEPAPTTGPNTFCVPDDDDDDNEVEVLGVSPSGKASSTHTYEIDDDSDVGSDEENQPPVENSTPITSPSNQDISSAWKDIERRRDRVMNTSLMRAPIDNLSEPLEGSKKTPIILDGEQRLVTPRMTPTPIVDGPVDTGSKLEDQTEPYGSELEEAGLLPDYLIDENASEQSDDWAGEEGEVHYDHYDDDSVAPSPYGFDEEEPDQDEPSDESDSVASDDAPHHEYADTESEIEDASSQVGQSEDEFQAASKLKASKEGLAAAPPVDTTDTSIRDESFAGYLEKQQEEQSQNLLDDFSYNTTSVQPDWSAISNSVAAVSPERPPVAPLPSFQYSSFAQEMEEWRPHYPITLSSPYGNASSFDHGRHHAPLTDRPAIRHPRPSPYCIGSVNYQFKPAAENEHNENRFGAQEPSNPEQHQALGLSDSPAISTPNVSQSERQSKTRVSIADILDASSEAPNAAKPSFKRKAGEMEMDSAADTFTSSGDLAHLDANEYTEKTNDESFSQDAQPQVLLSDLKGSCSQLTGIHTVTESEPTKDALPESEKPRKKAKTSKGSSNGGFTSHAATAIISAVVGGLGTIALLASLPPDYFV